MLNPKICLLFSFLALCYLSEKTEAKFGFGKPSAQVTGFHIPSINLEKVDFVVDVLIKNPNPIPIPLVDINYSIESNGRQLISGFIKDAGTIKRYGEKTVSIPISLNYADLITTFADIKPGNVIPYKIKIDLVVHVPIVGKITLPIEKTGEIPIPNSPDVDIENISFDKFSYEESVAVLHLKISNTNDFDSILKGLDFEFWISDLSIGGAQLARTANLVKNGICYVDITITFRPKNFGYSLWKIIRGKGTDYTIKGHIDVDTPFGPMTLPFSKEGGTTRLEKNEQ